MADGALGLKEVVAMGVGGMVSGGIFAVLGVAMQQSGNAVPMSFLLAGILTLITGYSYLKLTLHFGENGGAFSFIEHTVENKHIAGFFGWVLIVGYVGVMAMYAFAFGAYVAGFLGVSSGSLLRPLISVAVIAVLVGVNIIGVKETGWVEDVLVYLKVAFLFGIAVAGIVFFDGTFPALDGFFNKGMLSPVAGFAIIFVAYEGFQLLCYDFNEIKDVDRNLARGMYISIGTAILIYILVSFMATLHLSPEQVVQHKEYALAQAVLPFLGQAGFVLVVVTAIQSTASGINATLFGASRLAHRIATENELPRLFSFRNREGVPTYALLVMGGLTAGFAALGSLEQITEFGSIAFLIADAAANYANLRLYSETGSHPLIPAVGFAGTVVALPVVIIHLYRTEPHILFTIFVIFVVLLYLEFIYIERENLEEAAEIVEEDIAEEVAEVEEEIGDIEDEISDAIDD